MMPDLQVLTSMKKGDLNRKHLGDKNNKSPYVLKCVFEIHGAIGNLRVGKCQCELEAFHAREKNGTLS